MEKARLHIYCGDGKGKTTAAIGLSVRSCGRGWPVVLSQFLKGSTSGELNGLRNLPNYHYCLLYTSQWRAAKGSFAEGVRVLQRIPGGTV